MKKLATTIVAAALLTGTATAFQPQPIALAEETNAEEVAVKPTITNITVDKANYTTEDGNATVRVTLDNIDAVKFNKLDVTFATDNPLAAGTIETGNGASNNYTRDGNDLVVNLPLTDRLSDGEYHLSYVRLNDETIVFYNNNQIPTIQPTFTYENTQKDQLKPELIEATLDKTEYEVGDTINLTVKFKDKSELMGTLVYIENLQNNGGTEYGGYLEGITSQQVLDENTGLRQVVISKTATQFLQNKVLQIKDITLEDKQFNEKKYTEELPKLQFTVVPKGTLTPKVEENKGDQEAPKKEENKDQQVAPKAEENKGDKEAPKKRRK